ncbi:ABC transporter permease [Sphaerisporangium rhizosphaerae]|uniref:Transport permease protein n=1 Tax=Sphaerisporangium rhizosphaerae TaxID=2269375 RepID=A0ABW2PDG2_9ACTN
MLTESLYRVLAVARINWTLRLRDPGQFISYLLMPMILMLVFKPVYNRAFSSGTLQVTTGMLVIFSTLALAIVGTATLTERTWHTWDRLRSTRVTTAELLLGKGLPVFLVLLAQQTILLTYGMLVIGVRPAGNTWLVALAVAVWGTTLLAIGTAIAATVRSHGELSAICDIGGLTLTTLGGAFVPVEMFPGWLRAVAPVSPGYWALSMLQAALRGNVRGTLLAAAVLLAVGVAAGTYATWRLSRGHGRTTAL